MNLWPMAAALAGLYELHHSVHEWRLRHAVFNEALAYARARGKPLLNVGCAGIRQWPYSDEHADVCIDVDVVKLAGCRAGQPTYASVQSLPFPSKYFGAVYCSHVLEHLPSIDDVSRAVAELERVADRVYILVPGRSLSAWLNPDHNLWLDWEPTGYRVVDRRTGEATTVVVRDPQPATPAPVAFAA